MLKNFRLRIFQPLLLWASLSLQAMAMQAGEPAPILELPELETGNIISLSSLTGKIVYVDFWASWCGPCRQSLPLYEAMYKKVHSDSFQILAVNLDEDFKDAEKFLKRHPVSYPVLLDPSGKSARTWSVLAMPSSYLVDSNGNLAKIYVGFEASHIGEIEDDIKSLLDRLPAHIPDTATVDSGGLR